MNLHSVASIRKAPLKTLEVPGRGLEGRESESEERREDRRRVIEREIERREKNKDRLEHLDAVILAVADDDVTGRRDSNTL